MSEEPASQFPAWGVLELMGHRVLAGYVSETTVAGAGALRIDIPGDDPSTPHVTQTYSPAAYYCFTPATEDTCRRFAKKHRPQPVAVYQLAPPDELDDDDDEPEGDDWAADGAESS